MTAQNWSPQPGGPPGKPPGPDSVRLGYPYLLAPSEGHIDVFTDAYALNAMYGRLVRLTISDTGPATGTIKSCS